MHTETLAVQTVKFLPIRDVLFDVGIASADTPEQFTQFLKYWGNFDLPFPLEGEMVLVPHLAVRDAMLEEFEHDCGTRPFYMLAQDLDVIPQGSFTISADERRGYGVFVATAPNVPPDFHSENAVLAGIRDEFRLRWSEVFDDDSVMVQLRTHEDDAPTPE